MRIAVVGHHVAPIRAPFAGGVESHTYYLARWLARAGHEVLLHGAPGSEVEGVETVELDLQPSFSPAARRDVSMPPEAFMRTHYAYQRSVADLHRRSDLDVVHLQSLHYLPVAMASTLPAPCVLTLHCPPTPWLEAALAARTSGHLTMNAVSASTAQQWRHVAAGVEVIPNGVDTAQWPAGPGGDAAIWTGRLVAEKAPHLAIAAARRAGLTLRLAGPRCDERYFQREIEPRLGDDVHYLGHLAHDDLARELGASAVALVTPDWEEPFGLVAAEAMATGTPVAGFARGGLVDVVGRRGGRLVAASDVDALARAALLAKTMDRVEVRRSALSRHGLDAMGQAYEALFERAGEAARFAGREAA